MVGPSMVNGVRVLKVLGEGIDSRTSPGAAIVEGDRVPARPAHGLRQVKILFVPGQAMADNECGMRTRTGRLIDDSVDEDPVAGNVQYGHSGRMSGIGGRVSKDRRGNRLCRG